MAFIDQVQDLTSLTVSDNDELSQFLKDGVIDVTNRWLLVRPQDIELFIRVSGEQTANDSLALNGVKIINVVREDGTNNQWRNCRKISPALQYDVTNEESLNYASKINPAYTLLHNGKVNVFPSAAVGGANSFKVYYVNNEPTDLTNNAALIHSHSDVQYFPADKVYLVVIYASMKTLQANMGATTITDLSVTAVPPDVPTLVSVTFASIDSDLDASLPTYTTATISAGGVFGSSTAPDYVTPTTTISGVAWATEYPATEVDLATPLAAIVTNVDLANATIDASPVPPDSVSDTIADFSLAGEFDDAMAKAKALIDDAGSLTQGDDAEAHLASEDSELVASTVQIASQELQRANLGLQDALQTFNTDMQKFQASGLGKFSAEVQEYQAEVSEMSARAQGYIQAAQGYANEVKTRLSATQTKIGEYQARVQDALNVFNEANASFQGNIQEAVQELQVANQRNIAAAQGELQKNIDNENRSQQRQFQNSINDMKAIFDNNAELIQKFGAEIQEYQAEVGTQVQEYTQNLQADGAGYQWLQEQYAALKAEYDAAFMIAAPKQQPQQQVRR